ncbi:DUF3243 domain-containing protein [Maledivibacter halophilus]|uniref:Uncharacterized protein n=1 Tax=Maledivibacter halophilus TaxID=36842 RepID=A0A1T5IR18_9FIRM|nr:DUF3243 domain-containing protein [Maledivibacter halophilus]SKC41600.1 Protein of unknown function [Maledivibacter halophilus]
MDLKNIDIIEDWDKWKKTLSKAVSIGENVGLSHENVKNLGVKVGEFLASNVDPENHEQRVLKELFDVGNKQEKEALTSMIIKMVQEDRDRK